MGTIGAVSLLIESKLREMRGQAIRSLLELEHRAVYLRGRLEDDGELGLMVHESSDLNSYVMTFVSLVDRAGAFEEAKGYIT